MRTAYDGTMIDRPPYEHPAGFDPDTLLRECDVRRGRSGGPGGQHRNKVETAVEIIHRPTGVSSEATERRSQVENHKKAVKRLRINLAIEERRAPDPFAGPTELWRSRVVRKQIQCNPHHEDFPAMLAEALDVFAQCKWEPKPAAIWLMCSSSQLIRFVKNEPRALAIVNEGRARRGLKSLK